MTRPEAVVVSIVSESECSATGRAWGGHELGDVRGRAPEAVESGHHERVVRAQGVETAAQRSTFVALAGAVLDDDAALVAARAHERVDLGVKVLGEGRDARVAEGHVP